MQRVLIFILVLSGFTISHAAENSFLISSHKFLLLPITNRCFISKPRTSVVFLNSTLAFSTNQVKLSLPIQGKGKRNAGIVLTTIGVATFAAGVTMAALTANPTTYSNRNGSGVYISGLGAGGVVMAVLSPALIIPGAILWKRGSTGVKMRKRRAD